MKRRLFLASAGAAVAAESTAAVAIVPPLSLRDKLTTRAEASGFTATSSTSDIRRFLSELDQRGAPIFRGTLAKSAGGRPVPYVVASRPRVTTPREAFDLGRPVVLLCGGVSGGSVEGKEALLALLRDLCVSPDRTLLDDLVLIFVPVLNPDGNDKLGLAALNQPDINGPQRVGVRTNAAGIDLDADFVRLAAPETRGLIKLVQDWKPDVALDVRASDASFADFNVTLSPSLHPAAYFGGSLVRDRIMPQARKDLREKFSLDAYTAGHFGRGVPMPMPPSTADVSNFGWFAGDCRPRSLTNNLGLRGLAAISVDAYAHDRLDARIYAARAAVESILGFCSEHDDVIIGNSDKVGRWLGGVVPVRGTYPAAPTAQETVTWELLALSSQPAEPGVPVGLKRTGQFSSAQMPIYDRYVGLINTVQPKGFLIPYDYVPLLKPLMDTHGIVSETIISTEHMIVRDYVVDRLDVALASDGRKNFYIAGHWQPAVRYATKFGALYVPGDQPLGPLASVLLEPESDDGLLVWGLLDGVLKVGYSVPIFRVEG